MMNEVGNAPQRIETNAFVYEQQRRNQTLRHDEPGIRFMPWDAAPTKPTALPKSPVLQPKRNVPSIPPPQLLRHG